MKIVQAIVVTLILTVALFLPGVSHAFTFDLYNTLDNTPTGLSCSICSVLELPEDVYGGYLVLLDPLGSLADQNTWSNVVVWGSTIIGGVLQAPALGDFGDFDVQLLSDGCACFPTYAQVTGALYEEIFKTPLVTTYDAGNIYNIHEVPEPSSLLLLGSGLAALGLWRRLKANSAC